MLYLPFSGLLPTHDSCVHRNALIQLTKPFTTNHTVLVTLSYYIFINKQIFLAVLCKKPLAFPSRLQVDRSEILASHHWVLSDTLGVNSVVREASVLSYIAQATGWSERRGGTKWTVEVISTCQC